MRRAVVALILAGLTSLAAAQPTPDAAPPPAVEESAEQIAARHVALLERYVVALAVCQAVMSGETPTAAAARHGFTSSDVSRVGAMTMRDIRLVEANHLGMEAMIRRSEETAPQSRLSIFAAENVRRCIVRATGPVDFRTRAEEIAVGWTKLSDTRGPDPESPDWHEIWEIAFTDAAGARVAFSGRRSFQGFGTQYAFFGDSAEAMPSRE